MKRLLLITERFAPDLGGLASSATRLVTTLCQLGLEVDVVTWSRFLQPGEVLPPESLEAKYRVYRIGLYRHWDMTMPHTLNLLDWLQQTRGYDAVWGHYLFPSGFLATWFAGLKKIPCTVSARGNDIDRQMFPPGDFARLQWTLKNANVITAVSADMCRKIQLLSGRDDVLVLKNAVDTDIFCLSKSSKITREQLGIAPDEVVLGFCGELREKKGQQFLLNALTTVRSQRPACLLIIGEVRASQDAVLQVYKTQQPENAQRIIVTGHLSNSGLVAQYLRLCDVYLQPSLWEGMPNALLEAMACGCCCIASDAGGIPEVILHGENGFILPRSQLHKLGEAVLECLTMPVEEKNGIVRAAGDRILNEYSIAQEQQQLQILLSRLMPN
ncbi:glycosyltransferase family 4 protein [Nodularia spumigena CS-584]|jgi:L-malate glycosyltransferase|uniref:Glycosyltransferase family 4 protein n=1 Tax=Nodularia spumigena UHCC 0060 TaxID=3110300 RepID=A0ABU5UQF8_NODSP|nr:glycosyltransferase family 4 protein [Nodularia spumigena]AHJ28732.1 Glycosyltransferase [Nodularia spumigena CCY9414]EAW45533.1 Glycosyl transferase, group 1 [Nodularia spumigena CCY9414]MDB9383309.1 glycosyltransferase family 4 protein [Nodularia spumigena CS-584]MEA5525069.1 glycosyltransferase family 4 protein [Nodularia spumigena UHCC 0143]MEA5555139.1 glycosyltransferase family 4 protein [Nodularia spumigena CH309]